jgi:hypothetical protein
MKKVIIIGCIIGCIVALAGCSSETDFDKGKKQLEQQGYSDVKNTGWNTFCCDKNDGFSTGFIAKTKIGEEVRGCFCSNFGKGVTIRYE